MSDEKRTFGKTCNRCATNVRFKNDGRCVKCKQDYDRARKRHRPKSRRSDWSAKVCQGRQNHERLKDMRDIAGPDYSIASIKI